MENNQTIVVNVQQKPEAAGYAKVCGVLALIVAILAFFIPVVGVLFLTPIAILLGIFALNGGAKGLGIATTIIIIINLVISPSFWVNVAVSGDSSSNAVLSWIDLIGIIALFIFIAKKRKTNIQI